MNEAATEPKSKRRWYQYSLRSLLIVMLVSGFFFAWVGEKVYKARQQKIVVAWVEEKGGWVSYDYQYDSKGKWIKDAEPPGPDWLREWIGIDYFCNVEHVTTSYINEAYLPQLRKLSGLQSILLFERPSIQTLKIFQEGLSHCKFYWHPIPVLVTPSLPITKKGEYWCQECIDWHREDPDPHTAPE